MSGTTAVEFIEFRAASVAEVSTEQRTVELVAVPYEEPARVHYRDEIWDEVFTRGAFDGIQTRESHVPVNRDHDMTRLVGLVREWWPERSEGLVAEVRIAETDTGNETLALAAEGVLRASIGFGVRGSDQVLDKTSRTRRINRAFVDHLAFVAKPAYEGAKVLALRDGESPVDAAHLPPLVTPNLDEIVSFISSRKG